MSFFRRAITPVLTTALLAGSAAALTASPAAAQTDDPYVPAVTLEHSTWAHIDKATPRVAHVDPPGDMPIGTWHEADDDTAATDDAHGADGTDATDAQVTHTARSFVAFDAARFAGARVVSATLTTTETWAADCASRAVELWQTNPVEPTTSWRRQPSPRHLLASRGVPTGACLAVDETFDVTDALVRAVEAADPALTLGLWVREHRENRPAFARRFAPDASLTVVFNTPPLAPTEPIVGGWLSCETEPSGTWFGDRYPEISYVVPEDPDGLQENLIGRLEIWPTDDPSAVTVLTQGVYPGWGRSTFYLHPQHYEVQHDTTYGIRTQIDDGTAVSPWSATCFISIDLVRSAPPTTSSPEYPDASRPWGDVGAPGTFTFDAQGDTDVVGFLWGRYSATEYVAADQPGGTATVTYTPTEAGLQHLYVQSIDRARHGSPTADHYFDVAESRPWITAVNGLYGPGGPSGGIGVPGNLLLEARRDGAIEFEYRLDGGEPRTVPVDANGQAVVTIVPERGGEHTFSVRSRTAAGVWGATRTHEFEVDTAPIVLHDWYVTVGDPTVLTFRPGMPGVVAYEYWHRGPDGDPEIITVPAGPDGTAQVEIVFTTGLDAYLTVRSRTADGTTSREAGVYLSVDYGNPSLTHSGSGKPGEPLAFTATTTMPAVTEYRWWIGSDEENAQAVAPRADGSAAFDWTPTEDGTYVVRVQATNATGAWTAPSYHQVTVYSGPGVRSEVYREWQYGGGVGVPGTFAVTPNMTDVVEYEYRVGTWIEPGELVTVPAAGGEATLAFTPAETGYHTLSVRSRSANGQLSGWRNYVFIVAWE